MFIHLLILIKVLVIKFLITNTQNFFSKSNSHITGSENMEEVICENISKVYKGKMVVKALDSVNLRVSKGEFFGFLGPNGASKTTLVRIFTTLLKPSGGYAWIGGYEVSRDEKEVRRIIGYAGQDSERSAFSRLTVRENLLYFAHALRNIPKEEVKERIKHIASAIGFEDKLN